MSHLSLDTTVSAPLQTARGRVASAGVARPRFGAALLAVVALLGCGEDKPGSDAVDTVDTQVDTTPDTADTAPTGTECCPLGTCSDSKASCVSGACLPKLAGGTSCYVDGQCPLGSECQGETFCACGATDCVPAAGQCAFPEGCCNGDGTCDGGKACINGVCRARTSDTCWRDDQCQSGQVCEGVLAPACGQRGAEAPGHCGLAGICCVSDAECGGGNSAAVCRGGRCVEPAPADHCWTDAECGAGKTCLGESLCACEPGASDPAKCALPSTPGVCGVRADKCCGAATDCGNGEVCVEGECAKAPDRAKNECWVDGHCGVGRVCEGASVCGCNEDGCTESVVGHCKTSVVECGGDAECPSTMRCVLPDQALCPDEAAPTRGVCVEKVDGGCWDAADCHTDLRCAGEKICRKPGGCDAPNVPGNCIEKAKRWQCCDAHNDCAAGFDCRNSDSTVTCPPSASAVCLNEPTYGENCWNVEDCPAGLACVRVWICGCNGKCFFNHMGYCEPPTNCQSDIDCGEGAVCARDPECFYSPCTTAATCQIGGLCQPKIEGGCWTHDECGAGNYCEGLRICPSDTTCSLPDQPGLCAPRKKLGECCTSFRGCEAGLRCLSPSQGTGCTLDLTSVCVPALTPGNSCYGDDDCDESQRCEGERVCPCGVESCATPPAAGTCIPR